MLQSVMFLFIQNNGKSEGGIEQQGVVRVVNMGAWLFLTRPHQMVNIHKLATETVHKNNC